MTTEEFETQIVATRLILSQDGTELIDLISCETRDYDEAEKRIPLTEAILAELSKLLLAASDESWHLPFEPMPPKKKK